MAVYTNEKCASCGCDYKHEISSEIWESLEEAKQFMLKITTLCLMCRDKEKTVEIMHVNWDKL